MNLDPNSNLQYPVLNQNSVAPDTQSLLNQQQENPQSQVQNQGAVSQNPQVVYIYHPQSSIETSNPPQQTSGMKVRNIFKIDRSDWSNFFAYEDGVISFSLKDITIILSILADFIYAYIAWRSCSLGQVQCDSKVWPMISDILALKPYDRLFICLTTFYTLGIMQINMRAFFKKLYGIIPNKVNDRIFKTGIPALFALPMIGIFDEYDYRPIHYASAGTFFVSFTLYCVWLSNALYDNMDKFSEADKRSIRSLKNQTFIVIAACIGMIFSTFYFGTVNRITPALEWFTALFVINFFMIISLTNPYYDSIHIPEKKDDDFVARV
ncbi:UNKNOWN [Stylonychia lemnae]|uniref:CWH43-like N-terminal domain-containing protein n=1 Tax=Stylonychia lemnae TaxID=5949 RepID=A0A078A6N1_STYLE|nr:UNKNOWN [Stylonychia lemnae]|eukprot:CDW77895.1 UNKNOWN [Stylonychia lemnae]